MPTTQIHLPLPQRLVWLQVALSDRFGPDAADRIDRRLAAYLGRSGISPITCVTRIALLCPSRSITAFDVSSVVAWLMEQPEVVLVRRERPLVQSADRLTRRRTHG